MLLSVLLLAVSILAWVSPYLLLQIPYVSSTKAKDRLRQRKEKRFLEVLSARIDLEYRQNREGLSRR